MLSGGLWGWSTALERRKAEGVSPFPTIAVDQCGHIIPGTHWGQVTGQ